MMTSKVKRPVEALLQISLLTMSQTLGWSDKAPGIEYKLLTCYLIVSEEMPLF